MAGRAPLEGLPLRGWEEGEGFEAAVSEEQEGGMVFELKLS